MTDTLHADWEAWFMTDIGAPLERRRGMTAAPAPGEAVVEVAGCGVCHTDLSFLLHGVKTRSALPLVLGHEISGYVRGIGDGVDSSLLGRAVIVPGSSDGARDARAVGACRRLGRRIDALSGR